MTNRVVLLLAILLVSCEPATAPDPLPSWNDVASRNAIIDYVQAVSNDAAETFIPVAERVAVFDNDGTLWAEQPAYFQLAFAISRLVEMAAADPRLANDPDLARALSGDPKQLAELDQHALVNLVLTTHTGSSENEFRQTVQAWLDEARHPVSGQRFDEMIYQPMRELLDYLRANDFSVYIVSGGGREFIRAFAERVYGVPPENVVGTMLGAEFDYQKPSATIQRKPEITFVNDGAGKPIGIQRAIGRRPVFAFGNSDGDQQMLQWASASPHHSFAGIVRHTDAEREWAYDRDSSIGHLDRALDQAIEDGWVVVDMQADWKQIFP